MNYAAALAGSTALTAPPGPLPLPPTLRSPALTSPALAPTADATEVQESARPRTDHYHKRINGVSHKAVTMPACARLIALLESPEYGNRLSEDHKTALMAILGTMTQMAQGELRGRWAFDQVH